MADKEPGEDQGLGENAKAMQAAMPWLAAVWKFLGGAAVGVLGGYWLDGWLGTGPWLLVALTAVGMTVGFYGFITEVNRLGKKKRQ